MSAKGTRKSGGGEAVFAEVVSDLVVVGAGDEEIGGAVEASPGASEEAEDVGHVEGTPVGGVGMGVARGKEGGVGGEDVAPVPDARGALVGVSEPTGGVPGVEEEDVVGGLSGEADGGGAAHGVSADDEA